MNNHELRKSVKCLIDFLDSRECGENYWIDDEGRRHNADIGYVSEFLEDLRLYLNGEWKEPEKRAKFKFRILYKLCGARFPVELFCEDYEEIVLNDKHSINAINGNTGTHIPLSECSFIKIYDVETEDRVYAYFAPV